MQPHALTLVSLCASFKQHARTKPHENGKQPTNFCYAKSATVRSLLPTGKLDIKFPFHDFVKLPKTLQKPFSDQN